MQGVAAAVYTALGCLAEQQGDLAGAAEWHARALAALTGAGPDADDPEHGAGRRRRGHRGAGRGAPASMARAAELLGLAARAAGLQQRFQPGGGQDRSALAEALSEEELAAAYARGRAQGRDEALALVP